MIGYPHHNKKGGVGDYYDPASTGICSSHTDDKAEAYNLHINVIDPELLSFLKTVAEESNWVNQNVWFAKRHIKNWAREILLKYE